MRILTGAGFWIDTKVNAALLPVDSALASVRTERDDWKPIYNPKCFTRLDSASDSHHSLACGHSTIIN